MEEYVRRQSTWPTQMIEIRRIEWRFLEFAGSKMNFELHSDLKRDGIYMGQFPLCQVLLINDAAFPWFVLVPRRTEVRDTIDLSANDHELLWSESRTFGQAIMDLFKGEKLNVASLGNMTPQLHVHHVVRYSTDDAWPGPIWGKQPMSPYHSDRIVEIISFLAEFGMANFESADNLSNG